MSIASRRRRLGVLGTFVWDSIWTLEDAARGAPLESWGGVAYSLAGAAAACGDGWEVVPLAKVGRDLEAEARRFLATLPAVRDVRGIVAVDEPNNRVELRYTDRDHRGEKLTGGVPPWTWAELAPHLVGLDALYVNFIAGFELELDVAQRLRAAFAGPLYGDLHSLFLGPAGDGPRRLRPFPEWPAWAACFDAVQMNEDELRLATGGAAQGSGQLAPTAGAEHARGDPAAAPHTAGVVLDAGPSLLALTLGPRGAAIARRRGLSDDPERWTPAPGDGSDAGVEWLPFPVETAAGDPTGAGDVWGATFFASLLAGETVAAAAARAHAFAAVKLRRRGASDLHPHLVSAR